MTADNPKSIVAFYLSALHSKIPSVGSQDLVFRGLENKDWALQSTAYRRHASPPTHSDFLQYNSELIDKAKNANYHQKENGELKDIELLAELRHYGAATALIDFTRDFLVALWFASRRGKEGETQTNGKVIIVNIGDPNVFLQLTSKDREESLDKILKFQTRKREEDTQSTSRSNAETSASETSDQKKAKLWYWQPRFEINHRLSAQKGVFIFGQAVINPADIQYWEVTVSKDDKKAIHRELNERFGINEDNLFKDLPGFAIVNDKNHEIQTNTADDYFQNAVQHRQRGDLNQAIQYINKAIELDSVNAAYLSLRSQSNNDLKRYEDALQDATKAVELEPDNAIRYSLLGRVNRNLKRYEDALKSYSRAVELEPDNAIRYYLRSLANCDLERYDDALQDVTKAVELEPDNAFHHSLLGRVNRDLKRYEDALKSYTRAVELEPDNAIRYYLRSLANCNLERYEDALGDAIKAAELEPDNAFHHSLLGHVNLSLKRYEDALQNVTEAIGLDPDNDFHRSLRDRINRALKKEDNT